MATTACTVQAVVASPHANLASPHADIAPSVTYYISNKVTIFFLEVVSDFNIFVWKWSKIAKKKKKKKRLILPYKTWWKPRFPMD